MGWSKWISKDSVPKGLSKKTHNYFPKQLHGIGHHMFHSYQMRIKLQIIESFISKRTTKYDRQSWENKTRTMVHCIKMGNSTIRKPHSLAYILAFKLWTKPQSCFISAFAHISIQSSKFISMWSYPLSSSITETQNYFPCLWTNTVQDLNLPDSCCTFAVNLVLQFEL